MEATIQDLLKAGAYFGHQSRYRNPKMKPYIYGTYNHINIINLEHTLIGLRRACEFANELGSNRKKFLLVGTKKAASDIIMNGATSIGQYYVNHRWMGGTLTNYNIISASIGKLHTLQKQKADGIFEKLTKKEAMMRTRAMLKLERNIGGIKEMNGLPDALFVVDVRHEKIAVAEANKLGIPVIGIVDSNSSPDHIDYVIPGNDDSIRSIKLFVDAITSSFTEGEQLAAQYSMMRASKKSAKQEKHAAAAAASKGAPSSPKTEEAQITAAAPAAPRQEPDIKPAAQTDLEPAAVSAAEVKKLREMSGAGIMACKEALRAAQGDLEKAATLLRESGAIKQLKRAERATGEGLISIKSASHKAIAVEINCETDFVARNDDFISFAARVVELMYETEPQVQAGTPQLSPQLEAELQTISQKLGENIVISNYLVIQAPSGGVVGSYLHTNNKLCALVAIDQDEPQLARDLAMQVAAMNPLAATPEEVPEELINKEREIFLKQIEADDKPAEIKEKMITGKLQKFAAELALSEQAFIKDSKQKIGDILAAANVRDVKFIRHSSGQS